MSDSVGGVAEQEPTGTQRISRIAQCIAEHREASYHPANVTSDDYAAATYIFTQVVEPLLAVRADLLTTRAQLVKALERQDTAETMAVNARTQRDALQERIDRVIAFRNDALDTSQSPWLGKEIVSALDVALRVAAAMEGKTT